MKTITKICNFCTKEFSADLREHKRGNAKYCSLACFRKYRNSIRKKKRCKCIQCFTYFESISPTAKYCCKSCKYKHYRSIMFTTQGLTKKLQTTLLELPCFNCQWLLGPRDVHHIIPVCEGGKNELSNLITLCPNCHRLAHRNLLSKEKLLQLLKNWTISSSSNNEEMDAISGN